MYIYVFVNKPVWHRYLMIILMIFFLWRKYFPNFLLCIPSQVRGAFFEMVCALCEFTPGLVQAEAARLCPTVLLSIDDTDPVVLPPVWEAVLHVVATIPVSLFLKNDLTWPQMITILRVCDLVATPVCSNDKQQNVHPKINRCIKIIALVIFKYCWHSRN